VIGVGRVKTPTLAIVCKRELEIRNFVPVTYFEIVRARRQGVQAGSSPSIRCCTSKTNGDGLAPVYRTCSSSSGRVKPT
jgi:DNA topoisomerase IA